MTPINNNIEFIRTIQQKMYNKKIESLTSAFTIADLYETDFFTILSKLLNNNTSYDTIYPMPHYNIREKKLKYFSLSANNLTNKHFYILPILLPTSDIYMKHINVFIINHDAKEIIYFDPYGIYENPIISSTDIKIFIDVVKNELININMINKKYKMTMIDMPIQIQIAENSSDWYYNNSCIILLCYFIMVYMSVQNVKKTVKLFRSLLNDKKEILRQLIKYTYVSIKI